MPLSLLRVQSLGKSYGDSTILRDVAFALEQGERVALLGPNGSGKSTLLKILAGLVECDTGSVILEERAGPPAGCDVALLPQELPHCPGRSLWEFALAGFPRLRQLEQELAGLEDEMARVSAAGEVGQELLDQYGNLQSEFSATGGYRYRSALESQLHRAGFTRAHLAVPLEHLSGGEKTRVCLARLLAASPRLLLLDEPTNHLDAGGMDWLTGFLAELDCAILLSSHDRFFLDQTVERVLELDRARLTSYSGNYSAYQAQKRALRRAQWAEYQKQEDKRRHLLEAARRQAQWARSAHEAAGVNDHLRRLAKKGAQRAKATEARLERLAGEGVPRPWESEELRFHLPHPPPLRTGRLLDLEKVGLQAGDRPLLTGVSFTVRPGEKTALVGPNGSGKSTLLRVMAGELVPAAGTVQRASGCRIALVEQDPLGRPSSRSALDELLQVGTVSVTEARTLLGAFHLTGDAVFTPTNRLSRGQQMRLALAKVMVSGAHLILLDEPTNHLDLQAREQLEAALQAYPGAVVIVSHDRHLLEAVADRVLALEDGIVRVYPVPYAGYRREAARERRRRRLEETQDAEGLRELDALEEERLRLDARLAQLAAQMVEQTTADESPAGGEAGPAALYLEISRRRRVVARRLGELLRDCDSEREAPAR